MARINASYRKLSAGYLFPEIGRRTREFASRNPDAKILRLGIGDTTEPIPPAILSAFHAAVDKLGSPDTYTGYGDSEGQMALRETIATYYRTFGATVDPLDIFVSDGAKSDSSSIQSIFSPDCVVAVQDPAYPVYVDSNVIFGRTGPARDGCYEGIVYMPCNESNGFFPDLPARKADLIYICSPNNPTGAVATRRQLETFVEYALATRAVIFFDSAYAEFIQDPSLPRSIYEIPGAEKCAIEINSFSKSAGFTGIRLGWSIVPRALLCEDGQPGEIHRMWTRRQNTFFNGASNIVQAGGIAALREPGLGQTRAVIAHYMENARIIREGLTRAGLAVFGGVNAPYVWLKTPGGMDSWAFFDKLLTECHVVGTPGAGFGPSGQGYFRLSAFGKRPNVLEAVQRIQTRLKT